MSETTTIVSKILVRGSIQDVWRELTKTDSVQGAMFNTRLHTDTLEPGGQIRMRTANGKYTGVVGEVLEFDPPRRFVTTFKFTQYDDPVCKVIHELKEVEGGVEYTLTATDVPVGTKTEKDMKRGGDFIVKTMKAIVENGHPPVGTRLLFGIFRLMEPFSPRQTRSDNWPLTKKVG